METKALLKKLSLIATAFLVLVAAGLIYWLYGVVYNTPAPEESKSKQTKVDFDLYTKIENPQSYGTSVSVNEPGYGRVDPFANYKEPPASPADPNTPVAATTN